jgi:hypothetical protein
MSKIPPSLIGTAAPALAKAFTHSGLNSLFPAHGFPGDPPEGNKEDKCLAWLRRANASMPDPLRAFGALIGEFMDNDQWAEFYAEERTKLVKALSAEKLSYQRGGIILGATLAGPSISLAENLRARGIEALTHEYERAYAAIESDPPAAVTAACAILESVCKTFLEAEGHTLPSKQVLGALWSETAKHLNLQPGQLADDDLKRILQGLSSIADGVAAIRTHEGSAHGRSGHEPPGTKRYRLAPRHARLAVHAAHTMAMFVLETWRERKWKGP